MIKKISILILLFTLLGCSISLSTTFGKYLLSKSINGEIKVYQEDFCIKNNITKLSECMLVMENYANSIENAKLYINSKNDNNFQQAFPKYQYKDDSNNYVLKNNLNISYDTPIYFSNSYTFDENSGMYTLVNYVYELISLEYVNYYYCADGTVTCPTLYKVNAIDSNTLNVTSITSMTYTKVQPFSEQEVGLYRILDNQGESYYYRGEVENNYVKFAGFIWRIVRRNGDGSVRLVYYSDGTEKKTEQGNIIFDKSKAAEGIGYSQFSVRAYSPNDVGYMIAKNDEVIDGEDYFYYENIVSSRKYVFAVNYEINNDSKTFILKGDNKVTDIWENVRQNSNYNGYYTCFHSYTTSDTECNQLFKIDTSAVYNQYNRAFVKVMTYSTSSYEKNLVNEESSAIKVYLDKWYENVIYNKYDNYLADNIFCSDRTIDKNFPNYTGQGWRIDVGTIYDSQTRVKPTLQCSQLADSFSVSDKIGNGALTYPVGLLTLDETRFAGLTSNMVNTNNYLSINSSWWLMTPGGYYAITGLTGVSAISPDGFSIIPDTLSSRVIRPVINLKKDVVIVSGDGTIGNPYFVA